MDFKEVSIRGRVAYEIMCVENAISFFRLEDLNWDFVLDLMWSYTNEDVGAWHYPMGEAMPWTVLSNSDYHSHMMEIITEDQFFELYALYQASSEPVNFMINEIFDIGTRDLYASVANDSPDTLNSLQKIVEIMNENKIPLPQSEVFKRFSIEENAGWGRAFIKEELL
jgi:hypothetical protein